MKHKRSSVAGNAPAAGDIETGELAINFPDAALYTKDGSGNIIELSITDAIKEPVKNVSGGSLSVGTVVYQSGTAGNSAEVQAASNSSASTMPALGIITSTLADEGEGYAVLIGKINGLNTSSFSEGDTLYVGTSGTLTTTVPSGEGALIQNIGKVLKVHASNGSVMVTGAGRTNATPNLNDGNIFIGNGSNQATTASFNTTVDTHLNQSTAGTNSVLRWNGTDYDWYDSASTMTTYNYTATANQTSFSGNDDNTNSLSYTPGLIIVTVNGITYEDGTDYTATSGTSIIFTSGLELNDEVNVIAFTNFNLSTLDYDDLTNKPTIPTDFVSAANGGTFSDSVTVTGDLTVDTNTLHVDSTNNRVGIGTSSPLIPIQLNNYGGIDGNSNQLIISNNTYYSGGDKAVKSGFSTRIDLTNQDGSIRFLNTSASSSADAAITLAERMRIDSSGQVGIGTSSPVSPLEIATTNKLGSTFTGTTNGEGLTVTQTNYTAGNYVSLVEAAFDDSGDANPNVRIGAMFDGGGSNLAFGTSNSYGSGITNTAMFINSSGQVGIGTSSPSEKLTVSGSARALRADDHTQYGDFGQDSSGGFITTHRPHASLYENFRFLASNNSGTIERMRITSDGDIQFPVATDAMGKFADNISEVGSGNFALQVSNTAQSALKPFGIRAEDIRFATGSSERMRIDSSGNVGIGTTSPTQKLTVANGYGIFEGIKVGQNGTDIDSTFLGANSLLAFKLNGTERMRIDSSGNVGIGTSSPSAPLHVVGNSYVQSGTFYTDAISSYSGSSISINAGSSHLAATVNGSERMRIDSSGQLLVGMSSSSGTADGLRVIPSDFLGFTTSATDADDRLVLLNRQASDGVHIEFRKANSSVGKIGNSSSGFYFTHASQVGIMCDTTSRVVPCNSAGSLLDNVADLGRSTARWDDIYATNGTIQTSDQNEKQQIASLTAAEITAAKAISKLFKTFKWNDSVTENGDNARTHTGVIAQEVQQAMTDAGLDAGDYAFFISNTWWETQTEVPAVEAIEAQDAVYEDVVIEAVLDDEGNEVESERTKQRLVSEAIEAAEAVDAYTRTDTYETAEEAPEGATERTRLGIRYPELLAFVSAATEQRLSSIESRLETLENPNE
ncbi:tail fiber domain-containing protein [Alphaproteobacteria bacterium]|nr:tail fiber domain-containing protein [Alphaproteobacteria bacterium]